MVPVQSTRQVDWIYIEVVVCVFTGSEGIAIATMLTQKLHIQQWREKHDSIQIRNK